MEDEVDLRAYIRSMLRHWRLILGFAAAAAVTAAIISWLLPPLYQASVLVSVAAPPYSLRLEDVDTGRLLPARTYVDLALSDRVLADTFEAARLSLPPEIETHADLRGLLSAAPTADLTLVRLSADAPDPDMAAAIANTWAEMLMARAGTLFGGDSTSLQSYAEQLGEAEADLATAEEALAAFQSGNSVPLLAAQLESRQAELVDYFNRRHQTDLLLQDAADLGDRLRRLDVGTAAGAPDDIALLMLVARVYSGGTVTVGEPSQGLPLDIQFTTGAADSARTVQDQLTLLEDLRATLEDRRAQIEGAAAALEPQLLELQGALAKAEAREAELTRARDLAEGQYVALAAQVNQARVAAQETANSVRIASAAVAPRRAISPRRTLNVLVGATLGGLLAVVVALIHDWWMAPPPRPARLVPTQDQAA